MFKDQDARTITPEEIKRTVFELKSEEHKPATIHRYVTVLSRIIHDESGQIVMAA